MNNDDAYISIMKKIDEAYNRAPRSGEEYSESFIEYLKLLYRPEEAELVAYLKVPREVFPMGLNAQVYRCASQVALASGRNKDEVKKTLNDLAYRRAILGLGASSGEKGLKPITTLFKMIKILRRGAENPSLLKMVALTSPCTRFLTSR